MPQNFLRRMRLDRGVRLIELTNEDELNSVLAEVSARFLPNG